MADGRMLLRLLAWFSPGFPTGAYAHSHGLEWAVAADDVADAAGLHAWIEDLLSFGSGRTDAILLRHAYRAAFDAAALAEIAELAAAAMPCRERRAETFALGVAFANAAAAWDAITPGPYPVAAGLITARVGIDEDDAAIAYVHAFAANLVSVGVRLVPLGQSAGLGVLAGLEPAILACARESKSAALDDIGGACWRADIAAMRHETQYTRLFRT